MSVAHQEVLAYVALGSNLGHRRAMLDKALDVLRSTEALKVAKVSSWYDTAPLGGPQNQPDYLNGVVELTTTLSAQKLLETLLDIEEQLGRQRPEHWGPRCIDLDLLLYGQEVINTERLQVPHPLMHRRKFVLRGLAEIAPEVKHPLLGSSIKELWQNFSRNQKHGPEEK